MASDNHLSPDRSTRPPADLTVRQVHDIIDGVRTQRRKYCDIDFTHDVYLGEALVGEAGMVQELIPGVTVGFVCLYVRIPSYGVIDHRFTLVRRPT